MVTGILITGSIVWGVVQHARIQARRDEADPALAQAVGALRDQVDVLQQQLSDVHDRLDFTERMLAQGRVPEQLPKGG
jgi:hypothetical protein